MLACGNTIAANGVDQQIKIGKQKTGTIRSSPRPTYARYASFGGFGVRRSAEREGGKRGPNLCDFGRFAWIPACAGMSGKLCRLNRYSTPSTSASGRSSPRATSSCHLPPGSSQEMVRVSPGGPLHAWEMFRKTRRRLDRPSRRRARRCDKRSWSWRRLPFSRLRVSRICACREIALRHCGFQGSAVNPKFAQVCGVLGCELRVQKRHYKDRA
jgi:hypothetical protein